MLLLQPNSAGSRGAALLILVLLLAGLTMTVGLPWYTWLNDLDDQADLLRQKIQRMDSLLARAPEIEVQLMDLEARNPLMTLTIEGPTRSVAEAALQARMSEYVQESGAVMRSSVPVSAESDASGALQPVSVEVQTRGNILALRRLLYRIETSLPEMHVVDMSVRASGLDAGTDALDVRLRVVGFRLPDESDRGERTGQ